MVRDECPRRGLSQAGPPHRRGTRALADFIALCSEEEEQPRGTGSLTSLFLNKLAPVAVALFCTKYITERIFAQRFNWMWLPESWHAPSVPTRTESSAHRCSCDQEVERGHKWLRAST